MQALYINQDGSIKIEEAKLDGGSVKGKWPRRYVRMAGLGRQRVAVSPDGPAFDAMDAIIETVEYEFFDTIGPFAVYEEL